jgi:hypothetical protein
MRRAIPPFPEGQPRTFRSTVHGTVFAGRDQYLDDLCEGDAVSLIPDPPGQDHPEVWVHLPTGEPLGHLPPEINFWLWPWLRRGGSARARAVRVRGVESPSWRRLLLEVSCGA